MAHFPGPCYIRVGSATHRAPSSGVTRQLAWDLEADFSRLTPKIIAKLPWLLDPSNVIQIWGSAGWSKLHDQPKGQEQWEMVIYNGRNINYPKLHLVRSIRTHCLYYTKNFLPENGILPWNDEKFDRDLAPLLPSIETINTPPVDGPYSLAEYKSLQFSPEEKIELRQLADEISSPAVSEGKAPADAPLQEPEPAEIVE